MNEDSFFSSEGRIGGGTLLFNMVLAFVGQAIVLGTLCLATHLGFEAFSEGGHLHSPFTEKGHHFMPLIYFYGIVTTVFVLFTVMMQLIKRLHDMGKRPMFAALTFVPGVNVLFLIYAILAPAKKEV